MWPERPEREETHKEKRHIQRRDTHRENRHTDRHTDGDKKKRLRLYLDFDIHFTFRVVVPRRPAAKRRVKFFGFFPSGPEPTRHQRAGVYRAAHPTERGGTHTLGVVREGWGRGADQIARRLHYTGRERVL